MRGPFIQYRKTIRFFAVAALLIAAGAGPWGNSRAAEPGPVVPAEKELLEVKVHRVVLDPLSKQYVVLLSDPAEQRALLMWIDVFVASAIRSEMQDTYHPRPLTHDLLENIIQQAGLKIRRIVITHEKANIYYATIQMEKSGTAIDIDARPSDSIVLALKFERPIYVSVGLFNEKSVLLGEQEDIEGTYGLKLQNLTPSLADAFSFASVRGVLVSDVREGSHAEKDGIERGDIFVEVGGEAVDSVSSMRLALNRIDATALARVFRKGHYLSINLHPN